MAFAVALVVVAGGITACAPANEGSNNNGLADEGPTDKESADERLPTCTPEMPFDEPCVSPEPTPSEHVPDGPVARKKAREAALNLSDEYFRAINNLDEETALSLMCEDTNGVIRLNAENQWRVTRFIVTDSETVTIVFRSPVGVAPGRKQYIVARLRDDEWCLWL